MKNYSACFAAEMIGMKMSSRRRLVVLALFISLASSAYADHNITINTADKDTLMLLTGIGEVKAQAIIDYRNANGSFQNKEDIMNVKGIGEATYNGIKDHIVLSGGTSQTNPPPASPSKPPSQSSAQSAPSSYVAPPKQEIFADAGENRVATVGADVEFSGRAYNSEGKTLEGLFRYSWNFGDGGTGEGRVVLHRFSYPGRYAVVLQAAQETESVSDTVVVEAQPAQLRIAALPDGAIVIENLSDRDIDLSRWILSDGGSTFALQKGTTVLRNATATFPSTITGLKASGNLALLYPNGTHAFDVEGVENSPAISVSPPPSIASAPMNVPQSQATAPSAERDLEEVTERPIKVVQEDVEETSIKPVQAAAAAAATSRSWMWWLGAFGLAGAAASAVVVTRSMRKKEWDIIEEKGD